MKKTLLLLALGCVLQHAMATEWVGEFRLGGKAMPMVLHETDKPSVDLPMVGAGGLPLKAWVSKGAVSSFALNSPDGDILFQGRRVNGRIAGKVKRGKDSGSFRLEQMADHDAARTHAVAGSYEVAPGHVIDLGPMHEMGGRLVFIDHKTMREGVLMAQSASHFVSGPTLGSPYPFAIHAEFTRDGLRWREGGRELQARKITPYRAEAVEVRNGDVVLKGKLLLPLTKGPHAAVVYAHGAGNAGRDVGMWDAFFTRQGMAVLSLDKRGVGESAGDWHQASMDDLASDWLAGVAFLRQRADIDAKRIGVSGSSQGGWTGAIMAARDPGLAFLIVRAGSADSVLDTMLHEIDWTVRESGFKEADVAEANAAARKAFALSGASWEEFEAVVSPYLKKPWADAVWPLHMSKDGWGRKWNTLNAAFDPTATLAQIRQPVLWFLGDLDHNVPSASTAAKLAAARQASGNADFTVLHLPQAGHAFTETTTGNNRDFAIHSKMAPGYWEPMADWLRQHGMTSQEKK